MSRKNQIRNIRKQMNDAANHGDIVRTQSCLAQLFQLDDPPTTVSYNILVKAYCRCGQIDAAMVLFHKILNHAPDVYGVGPDEGTFAAIVGGLTQYGRLEESWNWLASAHEYGFSTNHVYSAIVRFAEPSAVLSDTIIATSDYGVKMDQAMLRCGLRSILKDDEDHTSDASEFVSWAKENFQVVPDCQCMTMLLHNLRIHKRYNDGLVWYDGFILSGGVPDVALLSTAMDILVAPDNCQLDKAEQILEFALSKFQLVPDVVVFNLIIRGCGYTRPVQVKKAIEYFEKLKALGLEPSAHTVAALLNTLCSAGEPQLAEEYIRNEFAQLGLRLNSIHYNILLKGYSRCRCSITETGCSCKVCHCADPQRAMELINEMETLGIKLDRSSIINVIESFASAGETSQARAIVENVLRKQTDPDLRPTIGCFNIVLRSLAVTQQVSGDCHKNESSFNQRVVFEDPNAVLSTTREVIQDISDLHLEADTLCCSYVIFVFANLEEWELALQFLEQHGSQLRELQPLEIFFKILSLTVQDVLNMNAWTMQAVDFTVKKLKNINILDVLNVVVDVYLQRFTASDAKSVLLDVINDLQLSPRSDNFVKLALSLKKSGLQHDAVELIEFTEHKYKISYLKHFKRMFYDD